MRRRTLGWMLAAVATVGIAAWLLGRADVGAVPGGPIRRDAEPGATPPFLEGRATPPAGPSAPAPPPVAQEPPAPPAEPAAPQWVEGRVVDPDGRGVEGIAIVADEPSKNEQPPEGPDRAPLAWTGPDGTFRLRASADAWIGVGRTTEWIRPAPEWLGRHDGPLLFRVRPATTVPLSGVVLGPSGEPVANTYVFAKWPASRAGPPGAARWQSTDERGRFRLIVPRDVPRVEISSIRGQGPLEGAVPYAIAEVDPATTDEVTLRFEPEVFLEGTVTDESGAPATGVRVFASAAVAAPLTFSQDQTDAKGAFRIPKLARGPHWLSTEVGAYAPTRRRVETPARDVRVVVRRARPLAGRIVDDDVGRFVVLWFFDLDGETYSQLSTDEHGGFTVPCVAPGDTALFAYRPGDDRYARVARADPAQDLEVRLVTGGRVSGRLAVPPGAPEMVQGIGLRLHGRGVEIATYPAPDGVFEFRGVPPGRWRVDRTRESGSLEVIGVDDVEPGTSDLVLTAR